MENPWGSIEKLEYRYTTTNLPLCNGTIIVLKITLLNFSISVITNFVIKKTQKKFVGKCLHRGKMLIT